MSGSGSSQSARPSVVDHLLSRASIAVVNAVAIAVPPDSRLAALRYQFPMVCPLHATTATTATAVSTTAHIRPAVMRIGSVFRLSLLRCRQATAAEREHDEHGCERSSELHRHSPFRGLPRNSNREDARPCHTTGERPPSTLIAQPVTYEAASETRKQAMLANSSARPMRPNGTGRPACAMKSSSETLAPSRR